MKGKILGIDYGTKRIGIAVSDEERNISFPRTVLENTQGAIKEIEKIISEEKITAIVLGKSMSSNDAENPVMKDVRAFKDIISSAFSLPVYFQPEQLTSLEAQKIQGKNEMHDASAAALILQRYLDGTRVQK